MNGASNTTGSVLPRRIRAEIRISTQRFLTEGVLGEGFCLLDRDVYNRRSVTQTEEQHRAAVADNHCDLYPKLDPLDVAKWVESEAMRVVHFHDPKCEPRTSWFHLSPPKLTGLHAPRVSKNGNIRVPKKHLEVAQHLTDCPFRIDLDWMRILWEVRKQIGQSLSFDERNNARESFMPFRAKQMAEEIGTQTYYTEINTFCNALRYYANCWGVCDLTTDKASKSFVRFAVEDFIDSDTWEWWKNDLRVAFKLRCLKDWCQSIDPENPTDFLLRGGCPFEAAACREFVRLEALPPKQRVSGFPWERDMAGSGILFMRLRRKLAKAKHIDTEHDQFVHPRKHWLATMRTSNERVPYYSTANPADIDAEMKTFIQPCMYRGGWGPIFDLLTGTEGQREAFDSLEGLTFANPYLPTLVVPHSAEATHARFVKLAGDIRKSFTTAFRWIDKYGDDCSKEWAESDWKNRKLRSAATSLALRMSRFRVNEEYDAAADISDDDNKAKSKWRIRHINSKGRDIKLPCLVTGGTTSRSCIADPLKLDDSGVSKAGRETHLDDSVAITEGTLIDMEMGINGRNNHDAIYRTIAKSMQSVRNQTAGMRKLYGEVIPEDAVIFRA